MNKNIRFEHYRIHRGIGLHRYFRGCSKKQGQPLTKGGVTICKIYKNDKLVAKGRALCSKKDNFSYAIGREIALGRAKKKLKNGLDTK